MRKMAMEIFLGLDLACTKLSVADYPLMDQCHGVWSHAS
jgi:hypothetical protein